MPRPARIGPYSARRIGRLLRGSTLLVIAAAAMSASVYWLYFLGIPFRDKIFSGAFLDLFGWQLAVWSPWLILVPVTVLYAERLMVKFRSGWRRVAAHVVMGTAFIGASGFWFGSVSLLPALGVKPMFRFPIDGGFGLYMLYARWMMPALIAVYVGSVMWATRGLFAGVQVTSSGLISEGGPVATREARPRPAIAYDSDDLSILAVNEAAMHLYGRSPAEFLQLRLTDLMTPESASTFGANQARSSGWFLWGGRSLHLDADGESFEVDFLSQRVSLNDRIAELLLITDLTEVLRSQAALRESERKAAELKLQLANARLRALQLQLKPHFLFNTLNTAAMMIRTGEHDEAQQMVTMLGDLFRRLLEFEGELTVSLADELEFVRLYLGLQQRRFFDRVEVRMNVDQAALAVEVPTLILQPLVENAISHGVAGMSGKCSIGVTATLANRRLVLSVSNDVNAGGPGAGNGSGHGLGLRNTRERLAEHHGDAASYEVEEKPGMFIVTIELPA